VTLYCTLHDSGQVPGGHMDEETKALLRSIAHHLKWVIVLLVAILGILLARTLA
jgi:hypothetical protein